LFEKVTVSPICSRSECHHADKLDTNVYTSKVHSFSTVSGEVEGKQLTVPDLNVSMDAMTAYRAGFSQLIDLMSYYQSLLSQDAGKLLTLRDELVDAEASLMKMIKTK